MRTSKFFERIISLLFLSNVAFSSEVTRALNAKCRDLLSCTIKKQCVQLPFLIKAFDNATISAQLYNDLDKAIDYGCIFTTGCLDECNRCPLCMTGKEQLVDVLSGSKRSSDGECSVLVNCASDCIEQSNSDLSKINSCLRHTCAIHCFDGTCQKCSAFVTRIFNQICVAAEFRSKVQNWTGHCYEMFREIVAAKFADQFHSLGRQPSIGLRQSL
ncbi:hypothetical protein M3Y94_00447800 [Aphelenchoides besseyi]|nr:hypothetical protein M3Y94_00447800 [Aphelenchoides besseyi]KAI6229333.1 hypothetical protein M3Y95_00520000 [Aphelenchoides besseyi]